KILSSKEKHKFTIKLGLKEELKDMATVAKFATVQKEGDRCVTRQVEYYNLELILSVGYRVKSYRGVQFRRWANGVLKDYLLKGYSVNQRLNDMGKELTRIKETLSEHSRKIDFFVRTSLPPVEGIFFDEQIFDAYKFATDLIKSAKKSLLLIDNYVDESVLLMLSKRNPGVSATIYTKKITKQLQLDLDKHNDQYPPVNIRTYHNSHDRFLIVDNKEVYHIGASLKDLGKKMFAFSKLEIEPGVITEKL
ncbi:RhuM family protein, partial [Bacteroides sp.]|uniref:RhuM family protein n=1 Tax=Bacteroides sp. TaxID=29523 RepID=UPI0025C041D7